MLGFTELTLVFKSGELAIFPCFTVFINDTLLKKKKSVVCHYDGNPYLSLKHQKEGLD